MEETRPTRSEEAALVPLRDIVVVPGLLVDHPLKLSLLPSLSIGWDLTPHCGCTTDAMGGSVGNMMTAMRPRRCGLLVEILALYALLHLFDGSIQQCAVPAHLASRAVSQG